VITSTRKSQEQAWYSVAPPTYNSPPPVYTEKYWRYRKQERKYSRLRVSTVNSVPSYITNIRIAIKCYLRIAVLIQYYLQWNINC
jgi:hypothetical protein